jgi:hypothetical protein
LLSTTAEDRNEKLKGKQRELFVSGAGGYSGLNSLPPR